MAGVLEPFELERYFAKHEFSAPYLLSSSDCDGVDYSSGATISLGAGDTSYTDTGRAVGHAGDLICYAIVSTVGTWRAQTTVQIQLS